MLATFKVRSWRAGITIYLFKINGRRDRCFRRIQRGRRCTPPG